MADYSKGKIYKLLNIIDDEIYVGSTIQPLRKRLCEHKCRANGTERSHYKVHHHMANLGIYNFYIELVELCVCSTKEELRAKEGEWIRKVATLNGKVSGRTVFEYRDEHQAEARERSKQWREHNRESKSQLDKHRREQKKKYIKECRGERIMCECGCEVTRGNISTHRKTKTHMDKMK